MDIYLPAEDSFLLEKYVKRYARGKVLDMGTGSGILAKAALLKTKDVLAVDINPKAVSHVKAMGINALRSDLFSNVKGKFDLIVFNPPYLPSEEGEDKETALQVSGGKKGFELIERFLKDARKHLNKGGKILLLFSSLSGDVKAAIRKHRYKARMLEEQKMFFERLHVYELTPI